MAGVASCVPARVVTNFELETKVDTSDEWISKRTGIKTRHVAVEETAVGMAVQASAEALAMSGVGKDDIGLIMACTVSG
ncbi:MAG: 3-oxoacyl-ACP synthase, partial [Christensenellaceae bacterium]|nr:3-oxoacyl-ACP synthase [Christensenellaceae bacterium]